MERKYKIAIPEPCHENWDEMTPKDNGRFCMNCSKTVVDFTSMLPEEVQHYFIQNQNNKICGRFKNSQLKTITIQIPSRVLYSQTNYHKMFLLALFIAMGTTLFSCADKDGNKNKIDNIEIVENSTQNQDGSEEVSSCYGHQVESKKVKTKKYSERIMMGAVVPPNIIETGSFKYSIIYNSADLDVSPVPENGMKNFYAFFDKNYVQTDRSEKFQGKISMVLVVEEDGTLSNFNIAKNTPKEIGEEAIKVLKTAPNWIPGKLNGKIVRSSYTLPITIK
ncbi:energy transducer TonB [Flavobacterium sp. 2]|uniref:energy transducer TonB n=1 Tax=Flavobacterium sp. 2 TaxID=308053 RepID=UPI003CE96B5F